MALASKISNDLMLVTSVLPVLTLTGLGGALAFNGGYFFTPFGLAFFLLDLQDLGLSFLYVFVFLITLTMIYFQFEGAFNHSGLAKWFVIVVVIVGALFPAISEFYQFGLSGDSWQSLRAWHMLGSAFCILIAFGSGYLMALKSHTYRVGQATIVLFSTFAMFFFGNVNFINDLNSSSPANLYLDDVKLELNIVTARNTFLMGVTPADCRVVLVERSKITRIEKLNSIGVDQKNEMPLSCRFSGR